MYYSYLCMHVLNVGEKKFKFWLGNLLRVLCLVFSKTCNVRQLFNIYTKLIFVLFLYFSACMRSKVEKNRENLLCRKMLLKIL